MTTNDSDKESDEQLFQNETDSHPPRSIISKPKTRGPTPTRAQFTLETLF